MWGHDKDVPRVNSSGVLLPLAEPQKTSLNDGGLPPRPAASKELGYESMGSLADSRQYAELKILISRQRLFEKQQFYYLLRMLLNFCLLGLALTVLFFVKNFGWQLVNAAFLGFVFTQMGFIVHDSGHHQILGTDRRNDLLGIFHADLCLGFSYMRWVTTHNMHHGSPNQLGVDPDVDFPVFTFTESQTIQKRGFWRWIAKYQSYFFFPLLLLEAMNLKIDCIRFLTRNNVKYHRTEAICLVIHFILYFTVIFHCLNGAHAVLFILVNQMVFGLYLGLVIAPNHIGMPILDENCGLDFLTRQLMTTRNLRRHPFTDYVYGPLCCQIEHHLFPTIPLNKLRTAQEIVRHYCQAQALTYYETSPLQSYREIISFLHRISAPLRHQLERRH